FCSLSTFLLSIFFLYSYHHPRALHSFPTRRSSDLSYCEARDRLPENLTWELVRQTGQAIHQKADAAWLFHGRPVKIPDGSTVSRSEEHTSELQSPYDLVCRLLLEKKK